MNVSAQLKHLLVVLTEVGEATPSRLKAIFHMRPIRAEVASPQIGELLRLALKLNLIKKTDGTYASIFPLSTNAAFFSEDERKRLKYLIIKNEKLIKEIADLCQRDSEFEYDYRDPFHHLLFDLGIVINRNKKYFLEMDVANLNSLKERIWTYQPHDIYKELGDLAEKIVLSRERNILKNTGFLGRLEHVSISNDLAGYDIKSFDLNKKEERYIEVKGTSLAEPEFFITKNELDAAKRFGKQYAIAIVCGIRIKDSSYDNIFEINDPAENLAETYRLQPLLFRASLK